MNQDTLMFFEGKPEALALYQNFAEKLFSEVGQVQVRVQKTQIAFSNGHNFAFVSFLPVRKAKERPQHYIVVTFGLGHQVNHPASTGPWSPIPTAGPIMS